MKTFLYVGIILLLLLFFLLYKGMRMEQEKIVKMDIIQYIKSKAIRCIICSVCIAILFTSRNNLKIHQFFLVISMRIVLYTVAVLFVHIVLFIIIKRLNK